MSKFTTYGTILYDAILSNNTEYLNIMVNTIDKELYESAYDICNNCDLNGLKELIKKGVDLSHPYFNQPDCFILNAVTADADYYTIKKFLKYLITNCMNINCIPIEAFYCMHNTDYGLEENVRNHPAYQYVPTLLDLIDIHVNTGERDSFGDSYLVYLLKKHGAKSGVELQYTYEQGDRLINFESYDGYNYEYMLNSRKKLHEELFANLYHPDRVIKYKKINNDVSTYLNYL